MKNKTSNRVYHYYHKQKSYFLNIKNKLRTIKMLGKSYDTRYLDYVCVDNLGRLILPNRLTHNFIKIIRKNNLKHIRFHDLRHSCASIMLSNGVPMKQIQEWLGHADFGTTANIYSHLDYKINKTRQTLYQMFLTLIQRKKKIKQTKLIRQKNLKRKLQS